MYRLANKTEEFVLNQVQRKTANRNNALKMYFSRLTLRYPHIDVNGMKWMKNLKKQLFMSSNDRRNQSYIVHQCLR